ncbi:MAG: hypothetical protein ACRD1H_09050, partial [Vicinamibacterales bacterium]
EEKVRHQERRAFRPAGPGPAAPRVDEHQGCTITQPDGQSMRIPAHPRPRRHAQLSVKTWQRPRQRLNEARFELFQQRCY